MANQPPVGRWMRMATFRPIPNPTQDPPSPQPAAPRPVLGRAFTAVPFRPAVPAAAMPPATVIAPPRQATLNIPAVAAIRPASAQPAAGTNGVPPPQGANNTTGISNGVRSPRQAPTAATITDGVRSPRQAPTAATITDGVPSPQRAPTAAAVTNGIPSPKQVTNAAINNGALPQLSQLQAPIAVMPNVKPSPQRPLPSTAVNVAPSPPKSEVAPYASPVQQTMNAGNGAHQVLSPQTKSPPPGSPPPTSTNITSPKAPFTTQSYTPKSPPQALASYRSPTASPLPTKTKQPASPPNFTSTTSAPAPRTVTFSNIESFTSPTKSQLSPAASTPQIPFQNKSDPLDRTPPQSPKTMSQAPPPSPLSLPPPQLRSDIEQHTKILPEPEQKSILFQQPSDSDKHKPSSTSNHKSPKIFKHPHNNKHSEPNDTNRSIITIAGENRGALMNLGSPRSRTTPPHPKFPGNPHKLTNPNSSESEESSGTKKNINGKSKSRDAVSSAMKSFMNSNVQGINNSIMFNSTVTHHDPGVHLALSRKHKGHDLGNSNGGLIRHYKEHSDGHQS